MVVFSYEICRTYSFGCPNNPIQYLVVTTNEITNDIIKMIDISNVKNVAFSIPHNITGNNRSTILEFNVDTFTWSRFVRELHYLEFRGVLVNNQLTGNHIAGMSTLKGLYIGATKYPLLEGEDVSVLPIIPKVILNGYGMVQKSENMKKWLDIIRLNGGNVEEYV